MAIFTTINKWHLFTISTAPQTHQGITVLWCKASEMQPSSMNIDQQHNLVADVFIIIAILYNTKLPKTKVLKTFHQAYDLERTRCFTAI